MGGAKCGLIPHSLLEGTHCHNHEVVGSNHVTNKKWISFHEFTRLKGPILWVKWPTHRVFNYFVSEILFSICFSYLILCFLIGSYIFNYHLLLLIINSQYFSTNFFIFANRRIYILLFVEKKMNICMVDFFLSLVWKCQPKHDPDVERVNPNP